jgi:hypothetical protein
MPIMSTTVETFIAGLRHLDPPDPSPDQEGVQGNSHRMALTMVRRIRALQQAGDSGS